MAETLGSLVDKLTIKSIREFTIQKMVKSKKTKFPKKELQSKLGILKNQKKLLHQEIESFILGAFQKGISLKDEKLKLYNKPEAIGKIGKASKVSEAIDGLARKNFELWQLEDEARREDVALEYIGEVKRKIDLTNQQRNDFIDKVDTLFEKSLQKFKRKHKKKRN